MQPVAIPSPDRRDFPGSWPRSTSCRGLWSIGDDFRVEVNRNAFVETGVPGQRLADFDGHRLFLPGDPKYWPEPDYLDWHRRNKFGKASA